MKALVLIGAASFLTIGICNAATVNWSAGNDVGLADSTGSALAQGNLIRIGYFTISDAAVSALAIPTVANVGSLNGSFKEFGQARIGDVFGLDAAFQAASNFVYGSNPAFTPSSQIYIWALKATNNTSTTTVLGSVTEQAIFYEPFSTNSNWRFPATNPDTGSTTIDIGDAKASSGGTYLAGTFQVSNPSVSAIFGGPAGAVKLQGVSPVPEPATFAVGMITLLAAAGSRIRRRK